MKVRTKLTLSYTLLTSSIVIAFSLTLYGLLSQQLETIFRQDLEWESRYAQQLFLAGEQKSLSDLDSITKELEISFIFIDGITLNPIYQSAHFEEDKDDRLFPLVSKLKEVRLWTNLDLAREPHTVLTEKFFDKSNHPFFIQVIAPRNDLYAIQKSIKRWIMILIPLVILIVLGAGYLFSQNTLRPLEEGFARMKQFTADASHELRIPLTSIKGALEVALRKKRSVEEYQEALSDSLEEVNRLEMMSENLLTLARTDGAASAIYKKSVFLLPFFSEIYEAGRKIKNNLNITVHLESVPKITILIDPDMMRRALLNLIENAVHYNVCDGHVWLGAREEKKSVIFWVRDSGPGIPLEAQNKIFERFYRVDKARSREKGGAGLGLSIVKSIVDAHGGRISVFSEMGKGSLFEISIPIAH